MAPTIPQRATRRRLRCSRQRHNLIVRIGSAWGAAQVQEPANQLGQPQVQSQRGRKDHPSTVDQAWSSKALRIRSGWLRGSIYWVLLVWGRFRGSKTIIPEAPTHFLTPSARRDKHLFGGLGLKSREEPHRMMADATGENLPFDHDQDDSGAHPGQWPSPAGTG